MQFIPIKTRAILPPKDDLYDILDKSLSELKEGDVLFITSKILSIHQGRTKQIKDSNLKIKVIRQEADYSLPKHTVAGSDIVLTIKDYTLIPSAGIDESNGNGYIILWPKNSNRAAKEICGYLKNRHKIKKLAVVVTDSHTMPLRWGTQGISIGF